MEREREEAILHSFIKHELIMSDVHKYCTMNVARKFGFIHTK